MKEDIHDRVTNPKYSCKHWKHLIDGLSPAAVEQQESSKWAKRVFWAFLASVCVAVLIFIIFLVIDHFRLPPQ